MSDKSQSITVWFNPVLLKIGFYSTVLIIMCYCGYAENDQADLIRLKNDSIEVGILAKVGGRVVLLRKPGLENVLKADESLWVNPEKQKPEVSAFGDFKAFNGHIVWVGPQSDWWINQDLNPERRDSKADWPPDPFLIFGDYEIIKMADDYVKMAGPASPVSGVRLIKEISLSPDGIVNFSVTAENIRSVPISLDLWMNTRLDGFARGYVPVEGAGNAKFIYTDSESREATAFKIDQGFFYFNPHAADPQPDEQVQEVHLDPAAGFIAGFSAAQMLIIRFEKLDRNLIHPNHGQVELYNYINAAGHENLLELEVHSAYRELLPGETISYAESWQVFSYAGKLDPEDQIRFLKNNFEQE